MEEKQDPPNHAEPPHPADVVDIQRPPELSVVQDNPQDFGLLKLGNGFASACEVLRHPGLRRLALGTSDPLRFDAMHSIVFLGAEEASEHLPIIMRENCERWVRFGSGDKRQALRVSKENAIDAIEIVARENSFHPLRDYLEGLGKQPEATGAIEEMGVKCLGLAAPLERTLLRRWAIGAVARAISPGCKNDTVLVLVGPQGHRKSTFFQTVAGDWFSDTPMNLEHKDSLQQLHESWICEWQELFATHRKSIELVRSFITSRIDSFREPYQRRVVRHPRTSVVVATTNSTAFLNDPDGHRRWWPISIPKPIDIDQVEGLRDAFWNEAMHLYALGHLHHLEEDAPELGQLDFQHDSFREVDTWEEPISEFLGNAWEKPITLRRVLHEALSLRPLDMTKAAEARAAAVMKTLGWEKGKRRLVDGERIVPWLKPMEPTPSEPARML